MTNPVQLLSDDDLREIGARHELAEAAFAPYQEVSDSLADIPALCQTVRALRQQVAELTAEWCKCGHAKTQHGFFSDHDECYECDQMSDDLCCEWRPKPRSTDTYTALREQLAQREQEWQAFENLGKRVETDLRAQLAQVTQEPLAATIDILEQRRRQLGAESIPEYARTINFLQAIIDEKKKEYPPLRAAGSIKKR